MIAEDELEQDEPTRDSRGRFRKGRSGNYAGRPRKKRPPVLAISEALRAAFAEEILVNGPAGRVPMKRRDFFINALINNALKATGKEQLLYAQQLVKMGALDPTPEEVEEADEPIFTEEDFRLLESVSRRLGLPTPKRPWNVGLACRETEE